MAQIMTFRNETKEIDMDGNETTSVVEQTKKVEVSNEPDFIKIYTKMWFIFNNIPQAYHSLFLLLVTNMSYCNSHNLKNSQVVDINGPIKQTIMDTLKIQKRQLQRGLKILCDCGAIRKTEYRGFYQINPNYAGKGEWKYNPKLERGGVEDLIAIFNFKDGTVDTKIVWADSGQDTPFDNEMRKALGKGVVVKETEISAKEKRPDQPNVSGQSQELQQA